ncbi:MAG: hypothetical protein IPG06_14550 [Haliea sp.]|nr:hypothetical protein [Haliea sp.]
MAFLQLNQAGLATDAKGARRAITGCQPRPHPQLYVCACAAQAFCRSSAAARACIRAAGFRDGTVLPQETLYQVFRDPNTAQQCAVIIGSNPRWDEIVPGAEPDSSRAPFRLSSAHQGSATAGLQPPAYWMTTGALSVDTAASIITANSPQPVFAYRWTGMRARIIFWSISANCSASLYGLEVAYIFIDFDGGTPVPGLCSDDNSAGRDFLGAQMRSYWSEFARNGDPGRGRSGAPLCGSPGNSDPT